jgi:hypothetical protein
MDTLTIIVIILIILVLCYMCGGSQWGYNEGMAPLNYGTFKNNYPRGKCNTGSYKYEPCEIGNCPLGTTITDKRYCAIQCAQDPDPNERKKCYDYCMGMMKGCD